LSAVPIFHLRRSGYSVSAGVLPVEVFRPVQVFRRWGCSVRHRCSAGGGIPFGAAILSVQVFCPDTWQDTCMRRLYNTRERKVNGIAGTATEREMARKCSFLQDWESAAVLFAPCACAV